MFSMTENKDSCVRGIVCGSRGILAAIDDGPGGGSRVKPSSTDGGHKNGAYGLDKPEASGECQTDGYRVKLGASGRFQANGRMVKPDVSSISKVVCSRVNQDASGEGQTYCSMIKQEASYGCQTDGRRIKTEASCGGQLEDRKIQPEGSGGGKKGLESFEQQHKSLEILVTDNWILLKENSNAPTWKKKFLENKLISERDFDDLGTKMKRSELAEWLLMKTLQNVKTFDDIAFIDSVVFDNVLIPRRKRRTEITSQRGSTENFEEVREILIHNKNKIVETLTKEDAITIKDHLVQNQIIDLKENEKLLKLERTFRSRKSWISKVMEIIINKLHCESYQCITQSLETITNSTRRQQITELLKKKMMSDSLNTGSQPTRIENMQSIFYDMEIEGTEHFSMKIEATDNTGQEVREAYMRLQRNPETVNMIFSSNIASSSGKTSEGSLVIHFHMLEKNMQDYIKECLRKGKVTTILHMLFSEISMQDVVPLGPLLLKVKIDVNEDFDLPVLCEESSASIMKFVLDNRTFLLEEMDTDAMEGGLKEIGIRIPTDLSCKGRKERANQIIDFSLKNRLEEHILHVIKLNKEERFDFLLNRLETYETVYTAEPTCLRKNILVKFSQIVRDIDVDDIRDILLERNSIEEHTLTDIEDRFLNKKEIAIATILLKILSSDQAVRAFVDALFVVGWPLAEKMLQWKSELLIVEKGSKVEICNSSPNDNLLFDGSFYLFFEKTDTPTAFLNFGCSPERNIHEKEISSVESSDPGSVLSPNWLLQFNDPTSEQKENCFIQELHMTQKYRESLQQNFRKIKKNIDMISMTKKAVNAGLVRQDTVSWIRSNKRSKGADLFLTNIIQNIELKDVPKFEEIISKPIVDQIRESCKCSTIKVLSANVCSSTLQCHRAVLIESLQPDDIEDLKDIFIEKFVIDIDDNEDIIRHPGFVMNRSKEFVSYFVDKFIIGKSSAGSINCLTQFLRETRNRRLQHILSLLEPESNESMGYVESRSEINRTLTVDQTNSNVNVTEIERKRFEISLTFQQKDQQTDKVCQRVISTVKSKNDVIASTFDGIITDSKEGSIIIHLTSLHEYTLQRVLHSINNEQFSKVLEILFEDEEIKRILTLGTYTLDMAVRQCEDELNLNKKPVRSAELTQQIADNISFLVEEIDTLLVFEKFRSQAIYLEPGIEVEDRDHRARYIIDIAMSDIESAEVFLSTLKDMPHVAERLATYERVYKTDPILVCKHILNQFSNISETVDLPDIRTVFVERKTFKEEELDDIEKEFYHDRKDVMAVFLTEVIKKGDDAMLTLVDALFIISMDDLAESLMSNLKDVFQEITKENASSNSVVQMKGQAFEDVLIASATFVLRIAKGEEYKSIATKCKEQHIQNSRKVTPQNDKVEVLIDSTIQTKTSTVTSSQEQESKSLGFRSQYSLKRPRDPPPDKLKPVHIEKRSRSLQTWSSYVAIPDNENIGSGIHKPSTTFSSSEYMNGQYIVTEPNILRRHQAELNSDIPYDLDTTYRQATYNREQHTNQFHGKLRRVFELNRSRRSFTGSLSPENTYQYIASDDESNDENKMLFETIHHVQTPDVSIKTAHQNTLTKGEGIYSAIFRNESALTYEIEKINNVFGCYAPSSGASSTNCTSANMIQQSTQPNDYERNYNLVNEKSESSTALQNINLLSLPSRHLNDTFSQK